MKKIEIEIPEGKKAGWVDGVLTLVDEKPKDVTQRIKTFEDACKELGEYHPFVTEWKYGHGNYSSDHAAYLKLRIVCAALNEGWRPKFTEGEWRYFPMFRLYTKNELENMSEDDKKDFVMIDTRDYDNIEYAGLAFSRSAGSPSYSHAYVGSHLCLKSRNLALYCGRQFADIWADYLLRRK